MPMWLMQLGEVVFGGVGSGLYGMLVFAIVAVFIAGLMVGRTPEYLGKKIEAFEMKMASLVILIPPLVVLVGTAIAVGGRFAGIGEAEHSTIPGRHGFSEVLYAFSLGQQQQRQRVRRPERQHAVLQHGCWAWHACRHAIWLMIPILAIAGSLAAKKYTPIGAGTLPTHRPLFVVLLVGVVILVGALTFVPALALGPIVEHLQMMEGNSNVHATKARPLFDTADRAASARRLVLQARPAPRDPQPRDVHGLCRQHL